MDLIEDDESPEDDAELQRAIEESLLDGRCLADSSYNDLHAHCTLTVFAWLLQS